jgi:hypothetical protein
MSKNNDWPPVAACVHPSTGELVLVQRGERGYWSSNMACRNRQQADDFNRNNGVTPAMRESMLAGSMFGWDVLAALPHKAETLYRNAKLLVYTIP